MGKRYVIVGGGAAGIAAAYKLLESSASAEVTLIEASPRYGGRALTRNVKGGLPFDEGCVYVQDPRRDENPWATICQNLNFATTPELDIEDYAVFYEKKNGKIKKESIAIVASGAEKALEDEFENNKKFPNLPVYTKAISFIECTDQGKGDNGGDTIQKTYDLTSRKRKCAYILAASRYGPFTEAIEPWKYLAADRDREESDSDWGGNLFVEKGLGNLVETYAKGLENKANYKAILDTRVTKVEYGDKLVITTGSGDRYPADACLITVSVGVLKANAITFIPQLPDLHRNALEHLNMGYYKKMAVELTVMPEKTDETNTIEDNNNYYLYCKKLNGIWLFYRLSHFPKKTLIVHAAGEFVTGLEKMENESEIFNLFVSDFNAVYKDYKFAGDFAITRWTETEWFRGAYSYTAPDENAPQDNTTALFARTNMSEPVNDQIYFAGEAYCEGAYGTLHGAYIDGKRKAQRMLARHELIEF